MVRYGQLSASKSGMVRLRLYVTGLWICMLSAIGSDISACWNPPPPCGECEIRVNGACQSYCSVAACETCINGQCRECNGDLNKQCCHGSSCCNVTESCCDDGHCCPQGQLCCGSGCRYPNQVCCNGTPCNPGELCCDGKTCYDPETKQCCGFGTGKTCSIINCEDCNSTTGGCDNRCKSELCEECDGAGHCKVCNDDPTKCCVDGECKDHCGLSCPCREDQYCCGLSLPLPGAGECCDADKVCCYNDESGFFCRPPCEITIIDCTTCAESHEEDYECPRCLNIPFFDACLNYTYREYTGLVIQGCEYGCRHDMGYEPCYKERLCVDAHIIEPALCFDGGENGLVCVPDYEYPPGEPPRDATPGISCDECGTGGEVVYTYKRYTCRNCFDD